MQEVLFDPAMFWTASSTHSEGVLISELGLTHTGWLLRRYRYSLARTLKAAKTLKSCACQVLQNRFGSANPVSGDGVQGEGPAIEAPCPAHTAETRGDHAASPTCRSRSFFCSRILRYRIASIQFSCISTASARTSRKQRKRPVNTVFHRTSDLQKLVVVCEDAEREGHRGGSQGR